MRTLDVPQANDLDTVRAVVRAVSRGSGTRDLVSDFTGYSRRHAQYRLHAARVLGLLTVEGDTFMITTLGERLIEAELGSEPERAVYYDAVQRSPVLQVLAPDLLGREWPQLETLTHRLFETCEMSHATAERRAGGLLAWRRRIMGQEAAARPAPAPAPSVEDAVQLNLFG